MLKTIVLLGCMIGTNMLAAELKQARELFSSWVDEKSPYFQYCIKDVSITKSLGASRAIKIFKSMQPVELPLKKLIIDDEGLVTSTNKLKTLRGLVEKDMPKFLKNLQNAGLKSLELNELDVKDQFNVVLNRYTGLFGAMFTDSPRKKSLELEFAVANRFVEFCFGQATFKYLKEVLRNDATKPVGRLLYAGMWQKLSGQGWKYWHQETLNRLRKAYQAGSKVVYIAGGSDIYQLIAHGIYNIVVIDPQLTGAQDNYYASGWQWLLKNDGLDDEFMLDGYAGKKVTLKRSHVQAGNRFSVVADDGKRIRQGADKVTWSIFEDGVSKGSLVFDRRLATIDDFSIEKNKEILMSFNELYFIAAPEVSGGWPIDCHQLAPSIKIHVKQLRKPISKKMLENIAWVEEQGLAFLRLGTAVK